MLVPREGIREEGGRLPIPNRIEIYIFCFLDF